MLIVKNRKALFNHQIVEKFLAGIELKGYEVKAIKENNVTFEGAHVSVTDGQVFVQNLHIGKYSKQSQEYKEQESRRPRSSSLLRPAAGRTPRISCEERWAEDRLDLEAEPRGPCR